MFFLFGIYSNCLSLLGIYGFDNSRSRDILGIKYKPFHESLVDTVKSLHDVNHQASI